MTSRLTLSNEHPDYLSLYFSRHKLYKAILNIHLIEFSGIWSYCISPPAGFIGYRDHYNPAWGRFSAGTFDPVFRSVEIRLV